MTRMIIGSGIGELPSVLSRLVVVAAYLVHATTLAPPSIEVYQPEPAWNRLRECRGIRRSFGGRTMPM